MDVYMRRRLVAGGVLAGVVLLIIVLVAGGGDDNGESDDVQEIGATGGGLLALSTEELADRADLICANADAAIEGIEATDNVQLIREQVAIETDALNQLRALQTEDVDPQYTEFLDERERYLNLLQQQALATEREDDAAVVELEDRVDAALADAQDAAETFGLEECAGAGGDGGAGGGAGGEETAATEDTGGIEVAPTPTAPVPEPTTPAPETTTPAPTAPDTGGGAATPAPAPDTGGDTGDGTGGTGGITPG
jgi:hypothetical protein